MLAARLQKPALTKLKKYDDKALEQLTSFKPRVAFLLTAPFEENLKEFEGVANDMAHVASFALVEDHKNTGLYPGKVGCVAPNASVHRFPGGDLRARISVFSRLRDRDVVAMAWRCLALGVAPTMRRRRAAPTAGLGREAQRGARVATRAAQF